MNIHDKIEFHRDIYQDFDEEIPPYRMTCAEHKELVNWIKNQHIFNKDMPVAMFGEYLGVKIEVVVVIEPYL